MQKYHMDPPSKSTEIIMIFAHCFFFRLLRVLYHPNSPFPYSETLVIRCGDKAPVLINEGDSVHRPKMPVILLNDFT